MATKPNPRLLPKVTYAPARGGEVIAENNQDWRRGGGDYGPSVIPPFSPPQQDPPPQPHSLYGDAVNASEQFGPFLNQMANSIYGGLNQAGNYLFGGEPGKMAFPEQPKPGAGAGAGGGPVVSYNPLAGIQEWLANTFGGGNTQAQTPPGWQPTVGQGDAVGRTPPGWTPGVPSGPTSADGRPTTDATGKTPPGWVPTVPSNAPADAQTQAARLQDAVNKNQNLTQQAKDTGNDKELARLQAEWDRIAPMAQKYGITPDRLVNSYMQPGNPAAESSLERAMGKAIADDTWAQAATIAFGRPPNQLEWDEHWRAMNKGGRDPLEGHPQAIQAIQQRMQEIQQDNQKQAFGQYQQWLNSQT